MLIDRDAKATGGGLIIRRAAQEDWPAIRRFLQAAYGPLARYKDQARWRWQFIDNPARTGSDEMPTVWIALDGGTVVGQIAVQSGLFWIDQTTQPGGWIVDVMILPAYRGQRLGHRLYAAVAREVPLLIMLTMAPATRRMAEHAGAVTLNPAIQFSRWSHIRADDVRRYVLHRLAERPRLRAAAVLACGPLYLHAAAAAAANLTLSLRIRPPAGGSSAVFIEEVSTFGPEFDAFWLRVRERGGAMAVRNAVTLTWRFRHAPDLRYRCFVARRDGVMAGYSVLRCTEQVEQRLGIISDLLTLPGECDAVLALLHHAIGFFGREVCSVECVTTVPDCARLLKRLGFMPTRTTLGTCSAAEPVLLSRTKTAKGEWYFTKSDHDWDQIQIA